MDPRHDFLEKLRVLNDIPLVDGQFAIAGSGPLAIRNWRITQDVDAVVTVDLYQRLLQDYPAVDDNHILIGNVEIWGKFANLTPRLNEVITCCEWIDGYPFITLQETLNWKRFLNREKDQDDIKRLEAHLMGTNTL